MSTLDRTTRHRRRSYAQAALARLDDQSLLERLAAAPVQGAGIGGAHAVIELEGTPVFVKRLPLTPLEHRPEHHASTRNLHALPPSCHYGVGSPGVGAWRELAANQMATGWALDGDLEASPLLYHWRVLENAPLPLHAELADVDTMLARWDGAPGVAGRLVALAEATATLALCFEYIPTTLPRWLDAQLEAGDAAISAAVTVVERCLREDLVAMNRLGLFHFDAHLNNILTDGHRLYFVDLGLATSPRFELSAAERDFLEANLSHDPCHALTRFVDWLVTRLVGASGWRDRNALIEAVAAGDRACLEGVNEMASGVIARYAPLAAIINAFYFDLHAEARRATYPTAEVLRACDAIGLEVLR